MYYRFLNYYQITHVSCSTVGKLIDYNVCKVNATIVKIIIHFLTQRL